MALSITMLLLWLRVTAYGARARIINVFWMECNNAVLWLFQAALWVSRHVHCIRLPQHTTLPFCLSLRQLHKHCLLCSSVTGHASSDKWPFDALTHSVPILEVAILLAVPADLFSLPIRMTCSCHLSRLNVICAGRLLFLQVPLYSNYAPCREQNLILRWIVFKKQPRDRNYHCADNVDKCNNWASWHGVAVLRGWYGSGLTGKVAVHEASAAFCWGTWSSMQAMSCSLPYSQLKQAAQEGKAQSSSCHCHRWLHHQHKTQHWLQ